MENISGLDFRESLPAENEYLALFETTGWNREYHLSAQDLHNAVRCSWYLIAAYDRDRLVATGRVISDGVFHALIVDDIVSPEYQAQGLAAVSCGDCLSVAGKGTFVTCNCFALGARPTSMAGWDLSPGPRTRLAWT